MKRFFYLLVVLTAILSFSSCKEKNAVEDSSDSSLVGTWIEVTGNDQVVTNTTFNDSFTASYKTAYVYKFTEDKWTTIISYSGDLDGDNFKYIEHTDVTTGNNITVNYYIKNGKIYTSVVTNGAPISFIDNKHVLLNNRTLIRKVNLVKQ